MTLRVGMDARYFNVAGGSPAAAELALAYTKGARTQTVLAEFPGVAALLGGSQGGGLATPAGMRRSLFFHTAPQTATSH